MNNNSWESFVESINQSHLGNYLYYFLCLQEEIDELRAATPESLPLEQGDVLVFCHMLKKSLEVAFSGQEEFVDEPLLYLPRPVDMLRVAIRACRGDNPKKYAQGLYSLATTWEQHIASQTDVEETKRLNLAKLEKRLATVGSLRKDS